LVAVLGMTALVRSPPSNVTVNGAGPLSGVAEMRAAGSNAPASSLPQPTRVLRVRHTSKAVSGEASRNAYVDGTTTMTPSMVAGC
jgi:hypothetical protein